MISELIRDKKIIVCCGAGGVGKTTTAAAIALAGARLGRRVLVLTVDPSRRLAEALGVARNSAVPVGVPADRLRAAGVPEGATLDAWMLDPKIVADNAVRYIVRDPVEAERFLANRIYQQISQMVAGMHEYTAMKALHRFVEEGKYDLIVLDTPPSRNALDFLESPSRVSEFLEGKIFKLFLPSEQGFLRRAASSVVHKVMGTAFGEEFAGDLTAFFNSFGGILGNLNRDLREIRGFLASPEVAFLLVTSPAAAALTEAYFFQDKTCELGLPFRGFVLNRSLAALAGLDLPGERLLAAGDGAEARSALAKLAAMALHEQAHAARDAELLGELKARAGTGAFAVAMPWLPAGDEGIAMLAKLSARMLAEDTVSVVVSESARLPEVA